MSRELKGVDLLGDVRSVVELGNEHRAHRVQFPARVCIFRTGKLRVNVCKHNKGFRRPQMSKEEKQGGSTDTYSMGAWPREEQADLAPGTKFATYKELELVTGIPVGTWMSWVHHRRVPCLRFGPRMVRFDREEIGKWLARHHVAATER